MIPKLYHFQPWEFIRGQESWISRMDHRLLVMLDLLRYRWGKRISISGHPAAVGRYKGSSLSQHNVEHWGTVRAVDIMPDGLETHEDVYAFFLLATEIGFTGIGFYPDWKPTPGFHVDVRYDIKPGFPTTWGYIGTAENITKVSLNEALEVMS